MVTTLITYVRTYLVFSKEFSTLLAEEELHMGVCRQLNTNFGRLTFQILYFNMLIICGIMDNIMEISYRSLLMFMLYVKWFEVICSGHNVISWINANGLFTIDFIEHLTNVNATYVFPSPHDQVANGNVVQVAPRVRIPFEKQDLIKSAMFIVPRMTN